MSRLCRLKTKSHGEDGLWAYNEITQLRAKVAELEAKLEKYENLEPVAYYTCQGNWPRIALAIDGNYDGYEIPLYALEK